MAELKTCTKCGGEFPATGEHFYKSSQTRNGLHPWCKVCLLAGQKQRSDQRRVSQGVAKRPPVKPDAELALSHGSNPGFKTCTQCGEAKPRTREHFYAGSSKDGLRSNCKTCVCRGYREQTVERHQQRAERLDGIDAMLQQVAAGTYRPNTKVCSKCGEARSGEEFAACRRSPDGLNGKCKACLYSETQAWREANPERFKAISKREYYKNRLRHQDYGRRYRASLNPERKRVLYRRQNEWKRKDALLRPEVYRKRSRVRSARWVAADPLRAKAVQFKANTRRRTQTSEGGITKQEIHALFVKQKGTCLYCGCRVGGKHAKWHIDHFIPLARGGTNLSDNMVIACATCNLSKNAKMPWEWMPERFSPPAQQ